MVKGEKGGEKAWSYAGGRTATTGEVVAIFEGGSCSACVAIGK